MIEITKEEQYKKVFGEFCIRENIVKEREMFLLALAMEYANFDTYIHEPKSRQEMAMNEIFKIKVFSFYHRKLTTDIKQIQRLQEFEHYQIKILQMKFIPVNPNFINSNTI